MRCVTHAECLAWCRQHGFPVVERDRFGSPAPDLRDRYEEFPLAYPEDSGRKIELARRIVGVMPVSGELLIWIGEWSVWPSSEHMPLFTRLRLALGERRPLIEAPGHLVKHIDCDDGISVVALALLFFWDCHVFSSAGGAVFACSHDEWCGFLLPAGCDAGGLAKEFEAWS